jgi:putative flippase GtrA
MMFNSVGAMGIVVQMGVLFLLTTCAGANVSIATALAVETAVLHNFIWHERWTWADRATGGAKGFFKRLLYFQCSNGAVSLVGNLALMKFFMTAFQLHYLPANALAIALCSLFNYFSGDLMIFRAAGNSEKAG